MSLARHDDQLGDVIARTDAGATDGASDKQLGDSVAHTGPVAPNSANDLEKGKTDIDKSLDVPTPSRPSGRQGLHSAFSETQKRLVVAMISAAGFISSCSSIYLPAINVLSHDLHVSVSDINLSVTTYMVWLGM